jgi:hypothetical protein
MRQASPANTRNCSYHRSLTSGSKLLRITGVDLGLLLKDEACDDITFAESISDCRSV